MGRNTTANRNPATGGIQGTTQGDRGGAYGSTLSECMSVWDPSSHMSKGEWRSACARTTTR
jgi:hypothetical protein